MEGMAAILNFEMIPSIALLLYLVIWTHSFKDNFNITLGKNIQQRT